ncbi:Lysosomal protective protein [Chionoecetes opilio]|uniref:Carboxypeptidase n=1 Tax=Chionoecetes opilio TaxID=41210 RepID=A0A8J5BZV8_CHIOP|nr:Lysosomal protective protein [Chionoecetes opilio]
MYVSAFVAVCLAMGSQAAPAADEITHLPGLTHDIAFKHYSGYLLGDTGKHLHYWFVESSRDPVGDPVVLWMNGGAGCSSMEGLLAELGPYLINPDGKTLKKNPYAWNTMANVLFLEAPACVGLSYDDHNECSTGDDETSMSNYLALQDFFTNKFPEYRNNSFFLTGESYAGIYVPTLAVRVLKGADTFPINLQGYAIGNALSSKELNDNSRLFFAYYHGLLGDDLWAHLVEHCCTGGHASRQTCNFHKTTSPECMKDLVKVFVITSFGLNPYNLYANCSLTTAGPFSRYQADLSHIMRRHDFHDSVMMEAKSTYLNMNSDPPCTGGTDITTYLNTPEVRQALHIPSQVQTFELCSSKVNYTKEYTTMKPQYEYLTSRVRGLVYNGDIDMVCNFLGDQWFVESLDLQVKEERMMWHHGDQVGGFVKRFANLDLLTVLGAGHMVPQDKPAQALKMITSFLFQKPY